MCETTDLYEYRHVCVQTLYVCIVCVCLALPNCKTGLGVYFCYVKARLSTAETDICKE